VHWGKPPHTIDFTLFGVLDGQYLLRPILVYKPKDLTRDWPPQFSTLWGKRLDSSQNGLKLKPFF
jgi:hypothetical protein